MSIRNDAAKLVKCIIQIVHSTTFTCIYIQSHRFALTILWLARMTRAGRLMTSHRWSKNNEIYVNYQIHFKISYVNTVLGCRLVDSHPFDVGCVMVIWLVHRIHHWERYLFHEYSKNINKKWIHLSWIGQITERRASSRYTLWWACCRRWWNLWTWHCMMWNCWWWRPCGWHVEAKVWIHDCACFSFSKYLKR